MSNPNLYFGDDSDSDSLDPSSTALPFPKPLDRSAFLEPVFNAADFLSSLTSRFQTLEDLQTELQDLLKSLNKELVDLVNDNYTNFLSLGEKLKGGEERIEEVRVGLLGFQRDVTGVRNLINERSQDVRALLEQKRALRKEIRTGRTLLEVDERLEELEIRLGISEPMSQATAAQDTSHEDDDQISRFKGWSHEWTKEDEPADSASDDGETDAQPDIPPRLKRSLQQLHAAQILSAKYGELLTFVLAQRDRFSQIKDVLRRDLEAAIRSQPDVKAKQRIIQMRAELDDD